MNLQREDDLDHFLPKLVLLAYFSSIAAIYLYFGVPDPQKAFYESLGLLESEVFQNLHDFLLNLVEVLLQVNFEELLTVLVFNLISIFTEFSC